MVTSTTSTTATPTATPTAQSVVKSATQSLLTSLGTGSGIDTGALVPALVEAQFAARTAALSAKSTLLTAQVSGVSSLKSAITGFSTALANLVKGGTLQTQPTSSNASVSATAITGAKLTGLSSTISVSQLATAQVARTNDPITDRAASLGTGDLVLTIGSGDPITITLGTGEGESGLDAIVAAINAKKTGVTASVVTDAKGGAYLSIKGGTGKDQGFTLKGMSGTALDIGNGAETTSIVSSAQNAVLTVDGIKVERASNSISDLVDGVKLQLNAVSTTPATLSSTTPTDALTQAVNDVVATYNEVMATITEQTDPITGNLRADPAATGLMRSLKALTLKPLVGGAIAGIPRTLAEIGVATNTDGTLRVDTAVLAKQIAANPDTIEAMFAPSSGNATGLSATLTALSTSATSTLTGLGAATVRYTAAQAEVTKQKDKVTDQSDQLSKRLTQQYASMNSRVTAYKATQSFLTGQIAQWNKSDS